MGHPGLPSAALLRRPLAALLMGASIALMSTPTQAGQLLGGLLDKPLTNLVSLSPRDTTRVIIRTQPGLLSAVIRLVKIARSGRATVLRAGSSVRIE